MNEKPQKTYTLVGPEAYRPPNYERVVRELTDDELRAEIAAGRGEEGYQDAARHELARRTGDENPEYGPGNPDWERDFYKTGD